MTDLNSFFVGKSRWISMFLYMFFSLVLSLSILLIPYERIIQDQTGTVTYLVGVAFWVGLIGISVMAYIINRSRKSSYLFNKYGETEKQMGITHFFQNREAVIADAVMITTIVGFIIAKVWEKEAITFVLLAAFVFSFSMHCMLNGINYKYIKYKTRR